MLYYANPASPGIRAAMTAGLLGCIVTPAQGNRVPPEAAWCADNGVYGKGWPGHTAWFRWLTKRPDRGRCAFAVAPDVVGDAAATLTRSLPWLPRIRALGIPAAYVAQDGQEALPVPWRSLDVLFIGGTTEWKLGPHAQALAAEARRHGKPVHVGRVNSLKRMRWARHIGATSADGTILAMYPDRRLPDVLGWVSDARNQLTLWGDT